MIQVVGEYETQKHTPSQGLAQAISESCPLRPHLYLRMSMVGRIADCKKYVYLSHSKVLTRYAIRLNLYFIKKFYFSP